MDGGKFKRKLSEVNTKAVSRGQNELVGKFKMAASDMVSIRGQEMEYTYIPFSSDSIFVACSHTFTLF